MGSFGLGTLFGFPIRVAYSFLLLLGGVFLFWGGLPGIVLVLMAFVSVLAHELGHALVARRLRVPIKEIELHFFGGTAKMLGLPRSAGDEIAIACAGPAVSFALSGVGLGLGLAHGLEIFFQFARVNMLIGLFNLLPALPMDGGRILRAILSRRIGFLRATELSVKVARGFALVLGLVGFVHGPITLVALAVLLWIMGFAELHAARFRAFAGCNLFSGLYGGHVRPQGFGADFVGSGAEACAGHASDGPVEVEYLPPGRTRARSPGNLHVRVVRWQ